MTVFTLSWGTTALGYTREQFLIMQLFGILCFGVTIPMSAVLAERGRAPHADLGDRRASRCSAWCWRRCFAAGTAGAMLTMAVGLALMGLTYGPLGTVLSELFPTAVRYTGSSLTFNLAGIFGASLAPYVATWLATNYGLPWVGYYLTAAALLTLAGIARDARNEGHRPRRSVGAGMRIWRWPRPPSCL